MPRPNKILEPTKTYNLNLTIADFDRLAKIAHRESAIYGHQVAIADLMREAIVVYLDALEESDDDDDK